MNKNLLAAVLATALAGCALTPDYQQPAAPVPATWPGNTNSGGTRAVTDTDWQRYFLDPRLQALITAALENNRDLRIATARIGEARAQYGIVQADKLPNLNLNAGRNASLTPGGASGFTSNPFHMQRYDISVSLVSFELDFWGRVSSLNEAAKASYLATEEAQKAFRLSLIADVASAYLSALEMRERILVAEKTARTHATSRELTMRRRDLGVASNLDFFQANGAYQATLAEIANLELQQDASENLLNLLVGKTTSEIGNLPPGRDLAGQEMDAGLIAGLPAEVLLRRPDVLAAELRLIAANANIGASRVAFFPKITLTGSIGTASKAMSGLFGAGSGAWSFQPVISQPLFDAGRNSANVDVATARKVVAVGEYEKTIQQAFREVADLLSAREKLAVQLAALQANAAAQNQRLRLVEARYQAGVIDHLEVLDAERESFAAQQNVLQARRTLLSTAAQLYKALGGHGSQSTTADK